MNVDATLTDFERRRPWLAGAVAFGAVVLFIYENRELRPQIDDAYIIFKYAQNLANGNGFVFNPGERVEGVTTLLWTGLVAVGVRLGFAAPNVTHVLSLLCGASTLWLTWLYASLDARPGFRLAAALSPWLLLATPAFAIWSVSGLETPCFAAAAIAALYFEARGSPTAGVVIAAISTLIRPEGALLTAVVLGVRWIRHPDERRRLMWQSSGYVLFLAALTGFRMAYFGEPLPNTFYAKVGGGFWWWGTSYALAFVLQILWPVILPSLFSIRERRFETGFAWVGATAAYSILVNGDAFGHSRFFVPVLPVAFAAAVRGATLAGKRGSTIGRFAAFSIGAAAVWFFFGTAWGVVAWLAAGAAAFAMGSGRRAFTVAALAALGIVCAARVTEHAPIRRRIASAIERAHVSYVPIFLTSRATERERSERFFQFLVQLSGIFAIELASVPPKDKVVASISVGALGYFSSARIIDLVGLLNPEIARSRPSPSHPVDGIVAPGHQRTNAAYVLSRKPDFILIPNADDPANFVIPATAELWASEEFQRSYVWDESLHWYRRVDSR